MSELSEFEEMYLKRLFEAHVDKPSAIVKTTQLAEMMNVSAASTTEMIQRRSEEHTSELQSLVNLVCRLLLEKKNRRHEL